jgi:hypothetical protein
VDIFNHRSSSRARSWNAPDAGERLSRCKSQPSQISIHSSEGPIWRTTDATDAASESRKMRKSLSPSILQSSKFPRTLSAASLGSSENCENCENSVFNPAAFQTLFLPGSGNKPLDPMAVSAVHRTVTETVQSNCYCIHQETA